MFLPTADHVPAHCRSCRLLMTFQIAALPGNIWRRASVQPKRFPLLTTFLPTQSSADARPYLCRLSPSSVYNTNCSYQGKHYRKSYLYDYESLFLSRDVLILSFPIQPCSRPRIDQPTDDGYSDQHSSPRTTNMHGLSSVLWGHIDIDPRLTKDRINRDID